MQQCVLEKQQLLQSEFRLIHLQMIFRDKFEFMKIHHITHLKTIIHYHFGATNKRRCQLYPNCKICVCYTSVLRRVRATFSMAGQTVTEERSQMDSECVEAVVVLKEALLNNMWPT